MSTPVLTLKQQRKSSSAKKSAVKGLKNVLALPFETYWPVLRNDECVELEDLLKRLLPVLKKVESQKIPWSKLRMMSQEERSAARKEAEIKFDNSVDTNAKESIVFGINSVTRLLEKDNVCSILLDNTVNTTLLLKHITSLAQKKNVPVFLVSFLKKVTLETVGFASAALGLKKNVKDSEKNHFYPLHKKISESLPEESKLKASISLFHDQSLTEDPCEKTVCSLEDANENTIQSLKDVSEKSSEIIKPFVLSTDVYLYRSSKTERVRKFSNDSDPEETSKETAEFIPLADIDFDGDNEFTPQLTLSSRKISKMSKTNNCQKKKIASNKTKMFSGLSETEVQSKKFKADYHPLTVKRLQGNALSTKRTKPKRKK